MEKSVLDSLESGNWENSQKILQDFYSNLEHNFESVGLDKDRYIRMWKIIFNLLGSSSHDSLSLSCLSALRILSRDKVSLNDIVDSDDIDAILDLADLISEDNSTEHINNPVKFDVVMEAQKCLSNIVYNSPTVQRLCCSNVCIPALMNRLKQFHDPEIPTKVKYFDMRLLFLLSAFSSSIRPRLYNEFHCFTCLIEILEGIHKKQLEKRRIISSRLKAHDVVLFEEEECEIIIQALKVLYNLVINIDRATPDEEHERNCSSLVALLRKLLLASATSTLMSENLQSNTVNLLLVMPPNLYYELLQQMPKADQSAAGFCGAMGGIAPEPDHIVEYDGRDMSAIVKILEFLHKRLKLLSHSSNESESLTPVLTLMVEMTQANRVIRKFVRLKILPPLRDVTRRPEEGETIRSRLCSLMTSPLPELKHLSANLLFILCKENVERLIKYTGYGNAAGLLASRGLMLGSKRKTLEYSSDSEASDTEEYERLKDQINPVTGRYEPPRPSPLDGMTEEQKEYEAMKLVTALDKLTRDGIIQPCTIRDDGCPHPVESIIELQENGSQRIYSEEED